MTIYSWFTHKKNVIFHSPVGLPEGKRCQLKHCENYDYPILPFKLSRLLLFRTLEPIQNSDELLAIYHQLIQHSHGKLIREKYIQIYIQYIDDFYL